MIIFTHKLQKKIKKTKYTATLNYNLRLKNRTKIMLDNGIQAFIFLKQRNVIHHGDILIDDRKKETVKIIAAQETLSSIYSKNILSLLKVCYHLGNRHVSIQIKKNKISYITNHVLDNLIKTMGLNISHELSAFEPEKGAYEHK